MMYVSSLEMFVTKIEDLRDKVDEDVYECVEHLVDTENKELLEKWEDFRDEFQAYESMLEECRMAITEQTRILYQLGKDIEDTKEYIRTTGRLSREKILDQLNTLHLTEVADELIRSL